MQLLLYLDVNSVYYEYIDDLDSIPKKDLLIDMKLHLTKVHHISSSREVE